MSGTDLLSEVADTAAAWTSWMDTVPVEDRARIGELLAEHDCSEIEGAIMFQQQLLVQLLKGRVAPVVIMAAIPLLDRLTTHLAMLHRLHGSPEGMVEVSVRETIREAWSNVKRVEGNYRTSPPNVIESAEPARLEAKDEEDDDED